MARIFLSVDNKITGLRFSAGPLGFPGFCRGVSCPSFISLGYSPVSAILLSSNTITSLISLWAYFKCSARNLSHPLLLLFFNDLIAFPISVIGNFSYCLVLVVWFQEMAFHYLCRIVFLKWSVMYSMFLLVFPAISPWLLHTTMFVFEQLLLFFVITCMDFKIDFFSFFSSLICSLSIDCSIFRRIFFCLFDSSCIVGLDGLFLCFGDRRFSTLSRQTLHRLSQRAWMIYTIEIFFDTLMIFLLYGWVSQMIDRCWLICSRSSIYDLPVNPEFCYYYFMITMCVKGVERLCISVVSFPRSMCQYDIW